MPQVPSTLRIDAKFQNEYYEKLAKIAENKLDVAKKNGAPITCEPLTPKDFAYTKPNAETSDHPVSFKLSDVDGQTISISDQSFLMRLHKLLSLRDQNCDGQIDPEFATLDLFIDTQIQEIEFTPDLQREAELRYNKITFLVTAGIEQPAHIQSITGTGFIMDSTEENGIFRYVLVTPWANVYTRTLAQGPIELRSLDQSTEILSGVKIKYQDYVSQLVFLEFTSEQNLGTFLFPENPDLHPRPGTPLYELNYSAAKLNRLSLVKPVNLYRTEDYYPYEMWRIETPSNLSTDTWGAPILKPDMSLLGICMYNDPDHPHYQMILPIDTVKRVYQRLVASDSPDLQGKSADQPLGLAYSDFGLDLLTMTQDDPRRKLLSSNYQNHGVMIGNVEDDSNAQGHKLQPGDIILEINGIPLQNLFEPNDLSPLQAVLTQQIKEQKPKETSFKIFRRNGNQSAILTVQVEPQIKNTRNTEIVSTPYGFRAITFDDSFKTIMPKAKTNLIDPTQTGVYIDNVARRDDGSPIEKIAPGLYHGDIVSEINGVPVKTAQEFQTVLELALKNNEPLIIKSHHVFGSLAPNTGDTEWVYLNGFKK